LEVTRPTPRSAHRPVHKTASHRNEELSYKQLTEDYVTRENCEFTEESRITARNANAATTINEEQKVTSGDISTDECTSQTTTVDEEQEVVNRITTAHEGHERMEATI
jgi:hypothetical protein